MEGMALFSPPFLQLSSVSSSPPGLTPHTDLRGLVFVHSFRPQTLTSDSNPFARKGRLLATFDCQERQHDSLLAMCVHREIRRTSLRPSRQPRYCRQSTGVASSGGHLRSTREVVAECRAKNQGNKSPASHKLCLHPRRMKGFERSAHEWAT